MECLVYLSLGVLSLWLDLDTWRFIFILVLVNLGLFRGVLPGVVSMVFCVYLGLVLPYLLIGSYSLHKEFQ